MSAPGGFFWRLLTFLFGKRRKREDQTPVRKAQVKTDRIPSPPIPAERLDQASPTSRNETRTDRIPLPPTPTERIEIAPRRGPYIVQIGLDFGTSFSKCVCRDIMTDKAWVHCWNRPLSSEFPFLVSSTLGVQNGGLVRLGEDGVQYHGDGLPHLKMALVKIATRDWIDPVLVPYRNCLEGAGPDELARFVEVCGIYLLAGLLGEVRQEIRRRLPGFGSIDGDYMAVNLAVPVADAERLEVNRLYTQVLEAAWVLADRLAGHPRMDIGELETLINGVRDLHDDSIAGACFLYPEVSANVQAFVRSRASMPGIYLFSDTGAGTVDQSVFIFVRRDDGTDHLTNLHGSVLALGSSQIERLAASFADGTGWEALEKWRVKKERGEHALELKRAQNDIAGKLALETGHTLSLAKGKLVVRSQLSQIRVIFGGGGHCENPYARGVLRPFSGPLFLEAVDPDVVGIPVPHDLGLQGPETRWMRRLTVAYGLSFEKSQLATFKYPVDVQPPEPEAVWRPRPSIVEAPSKDEC